MDKFNTSAPRSASAEKAAPAVKPTTNSKPKVMLGDCVKIW